MSKEEKAAKEAPNEKAKALLLTLEKLDKQYGKGTVMKLGDNSIVESEVVPTGSLGLDLALGIGGFPRGRIIEIYGPESSGKTTLAIHAIAQTQKRGGVCAIIDAEHAFDKKYAEALGVDTDNLYITRCFGRSGRFWRRYGPIFCDSVRRC